MNNIYDGLQIKYTKNNKTYLETLREFKISCTNELEQALTKYVETKTDRVNLWKNKNLENDFFQNFLVNFNNCTTYDIKILSVC